MLKKTLVSIALLSMSVSVFAAKNRPDGYVTICKIGQTCSVSSPTNVAFGAADKFVYKVLSGSFSCSVATFGSDPNPAKAVKECSVPSGSSGGGTSSSASSNSSTSSSSSSSGGGNSGSITGASCSANGSTTVNSTIRVTSGTYDGSCRVHNGGGDLGDGSQDEGQDPIFRVENGATLRNVIIGNNGADGIHVYNSGNVDNVTWQNVGEDALTIKSSGTVNVTNIEGYDAGDKFFQVNAASTLRVSNCIIRNAGKALRQNGGTTYKIDVAFDRCDLSGLNEGVFRTDSSSSVARITNSRLESGTTICIGFSSGNCSSSGITYY